MNCLDNIKELIENDIVLKNKHKLIEIILCKETYEIVVKYVIDERILMSNYELEK